MPDEFAQVMVSSILAEFRTLYPQIALDLYLTSRRVDLVQEHVDLAVRLGKQPDSGLIGRVIAQLSGGLYASPDYLAEHGYPENLEQLSEHQCLRFSLGNQDEWKLTSSAGESKTVPVQGMLMSNSRSARVGVSTGSTND